MKKTVILRYRNITHNIFLGIKVSVVWERQRDGRRRIETDTLTRNVFCWPYQAVLSSRNRLALLLLLGRRVLNPRFSVGCCATVTERSSGCKLRLTKTHSAPISRGHLHISFKKTHPFPFNYVTASAYFNKCFLCRESQIDGSVKYQYAIVGYELYVKYKHPRLIFEFRWLCLYSMTMNYNITSTYHKWFICFFIEYLRCSIPGQVITKTKKNGTWCHLA